MEELRTKLHTLVEEKSNLLQQVQDGKSTKSAAARECDDLRKQLKDAKTQRLASMRDLDSAREQFKDAALALEQVKAEKVILAQSVDELRAKVREHSFAQQAARDDANELRHQLQVELINKMKSKIS